MTITSTGLGSGLDIESLVKGLVSAEGGPATQLLTDKQTVLQADLSALGTLKSALATFQTSVRTMTDISAFQVRTATSSDTSSFTATADSTSVAGSFAIRVDQLAVAEKKHTAALAFASDTALVGAGTLDISLGANHFNITTSNATTLAGVRDLINQSSTNPGITASIIKVSATDSQLVLTSNVTGAANTIGVAATPTTASPGNDLNRFVTANLVPVQTAADSIIQLDGQSVTRSSNSLSDVISGVTIGLVKADKTIPAGALTVAVDQNAAKSKVNDFIAAYNTLAGTLQSLSSYDATTKTATPLFSDAALRGIKSQLRQTLSNPVAGGLSGFSTLASIGVTTDKNGLLTLDSAKLDKVAAANPDAVPKLFASVQGLTPAFDSLLTNVLSFDGSLTARVNGINKSIAGVTDQQTKLNARLVTVEARYRAQFNAMDTLLGQLKSTGAYLTQQLTPAAKTQ